jgi:hypothetical protein
MPQVRRRSRPYVAVAQPTVLFLRALCGLGQVRLTAGPVDLPFRRLDSSEGAMGEGIAIDAAGHVYTAEAQLRGVTKYVKE